MHLEITPSTSRIMYMYSISCCMYEGHIYSSMSLSKSNSVYNSGNKLQNNVLKNNTNNHKTRV